MSKKTNPKRTIKDLKRIYGDSLTEREWYNFIDWINSWADIKEHTFLAKEDDGTVSEWCKGYYQAINDVYKKIQRYKEEGGVE